MTPCSPADLWVIFEERAAPILDPDNGDGMSSNRCPL
jgi:hypothetical protein